MSELLKNLPYDWEFSTLGDLNSRKASTLNPKNFADETFEYYSIPDFQRGQRPSLTKGGAIESSKLLLKPKTVLFGKLNPRVEKVWRVAESPEFRQIGSTEWITILPTDRVDVDFLYFLEWSDHVMPIAKTLVSGSTPSRQRVDPTSFYRLRVPLPPLPEQKKIAHILSTVQRAIESQERIIQTTTELKKTLMHKLFTEGLRNEPQKQTEIGPVPESWGVVPLATLIRSKLQNGKFVQKPETGKGFLFANVVDMYRETHLDLSRLERLDVAADSIAQYWLEDGDILVVRSSLKREGIGQNCVARNLSESVFYDCHLIRVQTDPRKLNPEFLSTFWRSGIGKNDLVLRSKTTTMTTINQQGISKALVPVASIEEQSEIVNLLEIVDTKIRGHRAQKHHLEDLFRTLLHQLMTAKTRVHELDILTKN